MALHHPRGRASGRRHSAGRAAAGRAAAAALAVAACALALTACGSVPSVDGAGSTSSPAATPSPSGTRAATPGSAAAGVTACTTAELKVRITHTGALGGQAGGYLRFTNDGAVACQMDGWPAVVALTAAGKATTLKRAQSTMFGAWRVPAPLPAVRLRPGGSAYAVVAADDHPAGSSTGCPAPYVRLRVSPPGSAASVTVSAWLPGAGTYLPSCTAINGSPTGEVSAVTPLSSLPH